MRQIVDLMLVENSTAGNSPKFFRSQQVEILHEKATVIQSVDGIRSTGIHPSKILWFGGELAELQGITNIKITAENGSILIDGTLNAFNQVPKKVGESIQFFVLGESA